MKPSYSLPLLLMAHRVSHRPADAFSHPIFQSYNTYPVQHDCREPSVPPSDPSGMEPPRWEAAVLESPLERQLRELQEQVAALLEDNSRLQEQLSTLERDYAVDVTALADRLELLMNQNLQSPPPQHLQFEHPPEASRRRGNQCEDVPEVQQPRPLVEFHARDADDDDDEEDDDDEDFERSDSSVDRSLLALSTKGMLLAQQSSLRARFRQLTNGVRSTFRGSRARPEGGGDEVVVTIEESPDPHSYDG